jgi:hypothetical protein
LGNYFQHTEESPISLGWESKLAIMLEMETSITCNDPNNVLLNDEVGDSRKKTELSVHRTSKRQKNLTINRTDDFFMANLNSNRVINGSNNKTVINTVQASLNNNKSIKPKYKAPFMVYYQNIRSIRGKIDELLSLWSNEYPCILCLSEHHLWEQEICKLCCSPYILAAKYCRNKSKFGGVCIYSRTWL